MLCGAASSGGVGCSYPTALRRLQATQNAHNKTLNILAALAMLALRVQGTGDECSPVSMGSHAPMNAMLWHLQAVIYA